MKSITAGVRQILTSRVFPSRCLAAVARPAQLRPASFAWQYTNLAQQYRFNSNKSNGLAPSSDSGDNTTASAKLDKPSYHLSFTCKKCDTRSGHVVSKQAYHHGAVLVQCPGCKNRHLIADHLKIFSDQRVTLEDILAQKGETVKRGTTYSTDITTRVNDNGDIEIEQNKPSEEKSS